MKLNTFVRNYALTTYTFDGNVEDYFIARLIFRYVRGRRVLDLGCGPVVPITAQFYADAQQVIAIDKLKANLDFMLSHSHELAPLVSKARAYRKRYLTKRGNHPRVTVGQGDVRARLAIGKFDAAMNLGCFGALKSTRDFERAIENVYCYLKNGGTFLSVSWIGPAKRPLGFNGKVDVRRVHLPMLRKVGFRVDEYHQTSRFITSETRRLGYQSICWIVARK